MSLLECIVFHAQTHIHFFMPTKLNAVVLKSCTTSSRVRYHYWSCWLFAVEKKHKWPHISDVFCLRQTIYTVYMIFSNEMITFFASQCCFESTIHVHGGFVSFAGNFKWRHGSVRRRLSDHAGCPNIYTIGKKGKRKARWKHLYFTFSFAGNGLTPTINNYYGFTVTLTRSVMDEKCNMQCAKLKIHNIRTGVCHFLMLCLKCSTASRVSIITLWIYENFMCVWVQEGSLSETYQFYVVLEIVKLN